MDNQSPSLYSIPLWLLGLFILLAPGRVFGQQFGLVRTEHDTTTAQNVSRKGEDQISKEDSLRIANEFGKGAYLQNRVFLWNKDVSRINNLTSAQAIYAADVSGTPVRDITNILSGRLPGLFTLQSSGKIGSDGASLQLRGQTPIIVVDGVIRSFTNFNPDDIKSITVMDDALATALYGLRSSGGAILITTKDKGETGFELGFSAQYGVLEPLKAPQFLGAYQYASLYDEAQLNSSPSAVPKYSAQVLQAYKTGTNDPYLQPNVNWYDSLIRKSTTQQRYSINMAGNGRSYHYYASLEDFSQSGIFTSSPANTYTTNDNYSRYNVRINGQVDFNKNIDLTMNLFGSFASSPEPGFSADSIMSGIYKTPPLAYPVYNPNGSYGGSTVWTNNLEAATVNSGYLLNRQRTVNADLKLRYTFDGLLKGLWASAAVSMNNFYASQVIRSKTFAVYQYSPGSGGGTPSYTQYNNNGTVTAGTVAINSQTSQTFYNMLLGYDHTSGAHSFHLLGSYNADNINTSFTQLNEVYSTAGITGSYDFKEKYLVEAAAVYSGLNYYPPGKRWGFLPSAGLGWVISKESFFHSKTINFLKIRGTAGKTAWANPGYFPYIQSYTINSTAHGIAYNIGSSNTTVLGAGENGVPNPNITWERAMKWDAGLEIATAANRLNLTLDYYRNRYYDQLITLQDASGIFGQTYPQENAGKTRYAGWEATVSYSDHVGKLTYSIKGNASFAYSKVLADAEPDYPYSWMYHQGLPVGQPFGYVAQGFYQSAAEAAAGPHVPGYTPVAGDIKYKDLNGDGQITQLDEEALGKRGPQIFFGLNPEIRWKGFDLSALFQGIANRNVDVSGNNTYEFLNGYGNVQSFQLGRWTPATAATATYPRLTVGGNISNDLPSSYWIRSGDYIRLKNLELGYTLRLGSLRVLRARSLRFFINSYNLVTWSKLPYYDPEALTGYYPLQRIINTGLSLKL